MELHTVSLYTACFMCGLSCVTGCMLEANCWLDIIEGAIISRYTGGNQ